MKDGARPILPLPPEVAAQIKSSTAVPSLASVTLGLIANSLDAAAQKINISIDFLRGGVCVEDDGVGIPPKELSDAGAVGKPYHTSKYDSRSPTIGSNGTFLASVAALSILTITSHHQDHVHHASLILHHSRPAARWVHAPSHQHISNRDHGTRVNVQDLFGNMPVRIKQRALESTNGELDKQYETLKKHIAGVLLAWHLPVSICLRMNGKSKDLNIRGTDLKLPESERKGLDLSLVCGVLRQCGYLGYSDQAGWIKTSARTPFITIRGAICLQPAPSKQVQFISLGSRPINTEQCGNILYDEVNRLFAFSSFGEEGTSNNEIASDERRLKDRRYKRDGFTNKQLKGGGKGVDRWPMFYIRIELQGGQRGIANEVEKLGESTLTGLLKVLAAMITGFLSENHFRPRANIRKRKYETLRNEDLPACSSKNSANVHVSTKTAPQHQDNTFSTWGRVKSGLRVKTSAPSPTTILNGQSFQTEEGTTKLPECPNKELEAVETASEARLSENELSIHQDDNAVEWINPISGAAVLINTRTGTVVNSQVSRRPSSAPQPLTSLPLPPHNNDYKDPFPKRLTWTASSSNLDPTAVSWSHNLLRTWENPVFAVTEEPIPQVSFDGPSLDTSDSRHHCHSHAEIQKAFTQASSSSSRKLSKRVLNAARVIAQVDKKFILISMPDESSFEQERVRKSPRQILVLVDQHAADERIRVETLLSNLTSTPPTTLAKAITFEVPSRERSLLTGQRDHFTSWGIVYTVTALPKVAAAAATSKGEIVVTALPAAIAERCRLEPKLLVELIRGEAWRREELGIARNNIPPPPPPPSPSSSPFPSPSPSWPSLLPTIPPSLLDMLNSRACRSAIMFNDALSTQECEVLVRRLVGCVFPFQCAHGRPCMVPVVGVGGGGDGEGDGEGDEDEGSCNRGGGDSGSGDWEVRGGERGCNGGGGMVEEVGGKGEKEGKGFGQAWRAWRRSAT